MFGLEKIDIITEKVSTFYFKQVEQNKVFSEDINRVASSVQSILKDDQLDKNEMKLLSSKLQKNEQAVEQLKLIVIQIANLVQKYGIEKKAEIIAKTPEQELSESLKQIEAVKTEDEILSYCLICNKDTVMMNPKESLSENLGKFIVGRCKECGNPINKSLK